jgi:hypothetical protein
MRAFLVILLAALFPLAAPSQGPASEGASSKPEKEGDLGGWIADLGHAEWSRREMAEQKILEAGERALAPLRGAAGSSDPERAHRARYLLFQIDPPAGSFDIIKVELGPAPKVVEVGRGAGPAGESLRITALALGDRSPGRYEIIWHGEEAGGMVVEARELLQAESAPGYLLAPPVQASPAVSILKLSEECRYQRFGVITSRDRRRYLTLLYQRQSRRSDPPSPPPAAGGEELPGEILALLLAQVRSHPAGDEREAGDPRVATAALRILSHLRYAGAREEFVKALEDGDRAATGALGLAALGDRQAAPLLIEILKQDVPEIADNRIGAAATSRLDRSDLRDQKIQAAALLAELGDLRGLAYLIEQLGEPDPLRRHAIVACLGDALPQVERTPELRERFLDMALSASVLRDAPWSDPEMEYFFLRAVRLLSAQSEADVARAREALGSLERLVAGRFGTSTIRLRTLLPLWRQVAGVVAATAPRGEMVEAEAQLLSRLLDSVSSGAFLSETLLWLEDSFAGAPLPETCFDSLVRCLRASVASDDSSLAAVARQATQRMSQILTISQGQLEPLVHLLIATWREAAAAPGGGSTLRQLQAELERRTGVKAPASNAGLLGSTATEPWEAWLEDGERVAAREAAVIAEQSAAEEAGDLLAYYEFDILVEESPRRPHPAASEIAAPEILDGRRLLVHRDRSFSYRDRWGNSHRLRLELQPGAAREQPIYRLNGFSSIPEGVPTLTSVRGKEIGVSTYESSPLFAGVRYLSSPAISRHRSLVLILPLEADALFQPAAGGADAAQLSAEVEPASLWRSFVEHHLLRLPPDASQQQIQLLLQVHRSLRLKESAGLLKALLARAPSLEIARQLDELGDPAGREYLLKELEGAPQAAILAARILAEIGRREGVDALLRLAAENPALFRRDAYQIIQACDRFLAGAPSDAGARTAVLDFLVPYLQEASYRIPIFAVIERQAGSDFGFNAARRGDPAQREAAQREALEAARRWWEAEKKEAAGTAPPPAGQ